MKKYDLLKAILARSCLVLNRVVSDRSDSVFSFSNCPVID